MKAKIEEKVKAVKDAVAEDNTDKIKSTSDELQKEVMNMGAAVYGQGAQQPPQPDAAAGGAAGAGPAGGAAGAKGGDDVIDAEFTDKQ